MGMHWLIGALIVYPCSGVCPSFTISNIFFSETVWPIKAKFYVKPLSVGGTKVCSRHLGLMTKIGATPIYGKNLSKHLLRNQLTGFHETWYVASGSIVYHSLFK